MSNCIVLQDSKKSDVQVTRTTAYVEKITLFCETNMKRCMFSDQDGVARQAERLQGWLLKNNDMEMEQWLQEFDSRLTAIREKKEEYETWKSTMHYAQQQHKAQQQRKRKRLEEKTISDATTVVVADAVLCTPAKKKQKNTSQHK